MATSVYMISSIIKYCRYKLYTWSFLYLSCSNAACYLSNFGSTCSLSLFPKMLMYSLKVVWTKHMSELSCWVFLPYLYICIIGIFFQSLGIFWFYLASLHIAHIHSCHISPYQSNISKAMPSSHLSFYFEFFVLHFLLQLFSLYFFCYSNLSSLFTFSYFFYDSILLI